MPKFGTYAASRNTQMRDTNDAHIRRKTPTFSRIIKAENRWMRCFLPLSMMLMSGLATAQDGRIECPPDATVSCEADIALSPPTLFIEDTAKIVSDEDLYYGVTDIETYAANPTIALSEPNISGSAMLTGAELRLIVRLEPNSCEEDIDIRVTSPAGGVTEYISPLSGCESNPSSPLYTFTTMLDISGIDQNNAGEWLIEMRDSNDQNPASESLPGFSPDGTEFSLRFADIYYFSETLELASDFSTDFTTNGPPGCSGTTYVYTYQANAPNGNVLSCEQTFTIANEPPTISCPSYTIVGSAADIVIGIADVETSCGLDASIAVSVPIIIGELNAPGTTYTYTYTATDECGRQATCQQTFQIEDVRVECPPDGFVECEADLAPSAPTLFTKDTTRTALDNDLFYGTMDTENYADNPPLVFEGPDLSDGKLLTGARARIFVKVENNSCEEDIDIRVTSPAGVVTEFVSPIEGCSDNDNTLYIFTEMLDVSGVNEGNVDDWLIELRDSDDQNAQSDPAPSPFSPAGTEFSVRFADIQYFLEIPEPASDFDVELTANGQSDCPGTTYTYEYEVTTPAGNTLSCEQTLTIANDPPTISCPADETVACATDIVPGMATFETSCELGASVDMSGPVIVGDADCPGTTYTYTFTVTDECGREASCDQVFTIENDGPVINCAENITVSCADEISVAIPTFESACGLDGEISVEGPVVNGASNCPGTTYTYTYIVEDACGRTASCDQVFTIENDTPPAISCPAGGTVFCAADIEVNAEDAVFTTSCDVGGEVSVNGPVVNGEPNCPGTTYTYTYTVEDACGGMASCEQTFTISNSAPIISCPLDTEVACAADIVTNTSDVFFVTSCEVDGEVSISGPEIVGEPDCPGTTYTYTYTVEDICGRTLSCDRTFIIENDAPAITCPADETVTCSADIMVDASNATFTTSCELGASVSVSGPTVNGEPDCPGTTYTYTYTVEDTCGRTASCEQIFTIENDELPTISCPAGTTVACAADIETDISGVSFSGSCGVDGEVSVSGPVVSGDPDCPGTTYTYTYIVTDECGRQASCEQIFTIENDPPVITCAEDRVIACDSEISVAIPTFETSCDLGGNVAVSGPVIDGTPNCDGTIYTYTFIGTDDCDRVVSCEQVFTIVNNEPPTITCPPNGTVFCSGDIIVDTEDIEFTTSCDVGGTVSVSDPVIDGEPECPGTTYTYTYIVEDACGKTASCEQVFTIANVAPTVSCPLSTEVACEADILVDTDNIFFATSCDVDGEVSVVGPVIVGEPDCPGTTYTYTYTVEDVCGRTLTCDQTFTIANDPPTIACPADETVACSADISVDAANAAFTTSCELGANVSLSGPVVNGEPDCPGTTYTYTYTVEDACGRTASCEQVFTIENDTPTITCPAGGIVACAADISVDAANAVFTTTCDLVTNVSVSGPVVDGAADCPGTTYTYTYTVEGACGRMASCEQVFTIENDPPTITCPADMTVECASDIVPGMADFQTSCELGFSMEISDPVIVGEPDCPGTTYTYTFTGIDECGREASCQRVFTIENDPPVIICGEDMEVSCSSDISVTIPALETSCDLDGSVAVSGPVVDGPMDCYGTTYTYTFTGTDDCGRTATCQQVFTIVNEEPPTIECPADATVFCSADIIVDTEDIIFETSCDVGGTVSVSDPVIDGEPDCPGTTYTYTYTAEDACGRTASCEQVFTIANVAPTVSCPLGAEVACSADIQVSPDNVFFVTSCDVDGEVTVSDPVIVGEPDCPGTTYTYTYTVEDVCGRTLTCDQTFTIANDPPTITCPADEVVACSADILVDATNATFTTSCELGANVSLSGPVINGTADCPGTTYTYTYTVEDACGRMASCEQVFTIENDPPTITCPADETVACFTDIIVDAANAIFTTSCDLDANVNVNGPVINGTEDCPGTTYTYTYTVEDACGRTASCEQVFTIENEGPTITCPADEIVECAADIIPGMADFETSCELGASQDVTGPVIIGEPDCPGTTYTYTYTVTDECGREASCERVFTIENDPPEIICSEDAIVSCDIEIAVSIPVFNTSCQLGGGVEVDGPVIDGTPNCSGTTYTYTFTGTDDCGRTASCEQVFTIENDAPTITCPADATVFCSADIVVDAADAEFTTSCGIDGEVSVSGPVVDGTPDCPGTTYTYTYTVEDVCGRTATCEQVFTIANSAPIISCPLDATVACSADISVSPDNIFFVTSCDVEGTVSVSGPVIVGDPDCPGTTYTYTYTVEDVCGRSLSCDQTFTIENEPPTITCPADEVVACAADILVDASNATFTTSCELGANVSVSGPVVDGTPDCPGTTYTYTYTVEDACGRTATCEQVFTIENDPPTISCPADATVTCASDIIVDAADAVFTVSCELVADVSVSGPAINGEPDCPGTTYTYTYTVEDACGRTASCEQIFTIENDGPTITCPEDEIVACAADIVPGIADFETSCELEASLEVTGPVIIGEPDCPGTTYTYTYIVEDACGRTASCQQVFTIQNEDPVITCPEDAIVSCASEIIVAIPTFETACSLEGSVEVSGPVIEGIPNCEGTTYTYTFTGTDACGRTVSCDQVFTIQNEPPTITCPAGATVFCSADIIVDAADAEFTTSCDVDGEVSVSGPVVDGEPDCPGTTYTYTYTVEDICGRTASCEQVFTIANSPPILSCPLDATVACSADIVVSVENVFFATSCDVDGSVSVSGPVIVGELDCPGTTYTYTYTVEDVCGRSLSCEQTFTIENDPPTITCPADEVVSCAADILVDASNATFTTSCELGANVSVSEPAISGEPDCPGTTYTYTYTVEDACGRTASCEQVFTIENEAPTITCPADEVVACAADIVVDAADAMFTVSCGVETTASVSGPVIDGEPDCPGTTYTYTYTIEDACGRIASCERVFTIENEAPTITCPADEIVACAADIVPGIADFQTSCELDGELEVTGPVIIGEPDCPGTTYTYTYTVEDVCGRMASCQQVFTIQNEDPVITCPEDMTVSCATEIIVAIPSFETFCQLEGSVEVEGPVVDGIPNCEGTTYTYTFIGTDACGRTVSCDQVFTIANDAPTISCPAGTTVFCSADIVVDADDAVFTTSCDIDGEVSVSAPMIDGEPDCPGTTYTYTYTVEDVCGRTASCEQVFTIANAPPVLSCPLSTEVACAADIVVDASTVFFATSCDIDGEVSVSEPVIDGEPDCSGTTYTYTYTVTDVCGRTLSCDQVFTIANDEPTITCPEDRTVECFTDIFVDVSNVSFTTSCELEANISISDPVIDGEPDCSGTTYTYTYTVEDACGRTASCDQIFTIDNLAPIVSCAADVILECSAEIMVDTSDITFVTSCGSEGDITIDGPVIDGTPDCSGTTYTYTYTVEDACGRTASCDRIFTIENAPPTISCPADTMIACASDIIPGTAEFITSCELNSVVEITGPIVIGDPDCPGTTYTYTYTGTDGCGRQASCQRVFMIQNEEPEIVCPEDRIVSCADEIIVEIPIFNTGCQLGGGVLVSGPIINGLQNCEGTTYTYIFIGTDDCGRTVDCSQVFTISNTLSITCPADTMVTCSADIIIDTKNVDFDTSCSLNASVSVDGPVVDGAEDCPGTTYTYTYTVEDVCGRTASCEQVYTIANDSLMISCPADTIVACAADIMIDTAAVSFESTCGAAGMVSVSEPSIVGEPDCPGTTYVYTYTVEDDCGRTASCEQVFTIENEPPTISCPADTIVACATDIVVDTAAVSFTTSCGLGGMVSVSEPMISDSVDCPGTTYIYTYTVEDACGRTASCEQIFTIENERPTITCPADTIVACAADIVVDTAAVSFTTSCGLEGTVSVSEPEIIGEPDCPGTTYAYTYTVEDACGRAASCEQIFTIENDEPTITCPADTLVACAADIVVDTANISFITSCGLGGIISVSEPMVSDSIDCPGTTYTYTYTVEDDCGRTASCEQVFTIENEAPAIISCPADTTVTFEADIVVDTTNLTFVTSCNLKATVSVSEPVIDGEPGIPGTTYTYTYTVEDACGRAASCDQVFLINNDAPEVIGCAPDTTVTCAADIMVDIADVTYSANCNAEVTVTIEGPLVIGEPDCPGTAYVYTYVVKSDCGIDTCERIFTVENEAPKINCLEDRVVACAADIVAETPEVITSCSLEVELTTSQPTLVSGVADCANAVYEIEYTAKDNCGRTAICVQTFTVTNDEPTITCPSGYSVICPADIQLGTPEFTTSCGLDGVLSVTGPTLTGAPGANGTTYIYTHIITDDCGRTASCEQVFTIENECTAIDFDFDDAGNALLPGTEITNQYEDFTVTTQIPAQCAQLFDTGNPTANDFDVGTPNEQYGGPGIGDGGASNTEFQGNALIASQNCNLPNETSGELIFTFDCGVTIKTVDLLDISCDDADIELYDVNQNLIEILILPNSGINGFYQYEVNVSGVYAMHIDLDCGGGVTGFTYCKDNTPGANCDATPSLCYDYNIDHSECGGDWQTGALSGTVELGNEIIDITISDPDNILDNTQADGVGLLVRSDPNDVDDEVIIEYDLSKSSSNVVFDIIDIDFKNSITGQQEGVCIYGTLGNNPTQILPTITSLEGSVVVNGNCAEGGASSAASGQDESILVEFTECIDKITIVYGSGTNSPTPDPDNSKIVIGSGVFSVEQCQEGCECPEDDDNDGVCNENDICPGGNDLIDSNGDGIPDDCEIQCDEYILDFSQPGYNWSGHGEIESYVVGNQTFDVLITDGNNIIESTYDSGAGLAIATDATNADDELVITYSLSQVVSSVAFDIGDLDYTEGFLKEEVCIYATLGDDPTQIMPTITSLNGNVAINGNCAEATVNSVISGQPENILVEFTECVDKITIVYGTGSDESIQDPIVGNIIIGRNLGFVTEICEDVCPELRQEEAVNVDINLYPNPVYGSGNVTIDINTKTRGDAQIMLLDALGRMISTENIQLTNDFTRHEISVDPLSAGIYFVQLQTQEWRTNGLKFIVVKP